MIIFSKNSEFIFKKIILTIKKKKLYIQKLILDIQNQMEYLKINNCIECEAGYYKVSTPQSCWGITFL